MRLALAALALLATLADSAAAQPASVDPRLAAAVRTLRVGTPTRISGAGVRIEGRFVSATADSLVLGDAATARAVTPVALASVDTLWRRTHATGRGATAGAVVGGIGLAAFGALLVRAGCESPNGCRGDYPIVALGGFTIGAVSGALLGGSVGYFVRGWRRVYP